MTTDIVYSQDIQQLEPKEDHMSWLPQKKLTVEKKIGNTRKQTKKSCIIYWVSTTIKSKI